MWIQIRKGDAVTISEEDVIRFRDAKTCESCLDWHKHCTAECCKMFTLGITKQQLDSIVGSYFIVKLRKPLTPSMQFYYKLRGVEYVRGYLRYKKEHIICVGNKVIYVYHCDYLKDMKCIKHPDCKPLICKALTQETAHLPNQPFVVTENCRFRYGKGDDENGKE